MQTKRDDHSDGLSITRRDLLRYGVYGAAGLVLFDWFSLRASNQVFGADTDVAPRPAKGKAVIQIWMWGGPCHLDTFDPKPDAGYDYCGPLDKSIPTNADGIQIAQMLPLLAKQADKYSIIRSMTHGLNGHESASYAVQTGRTPGGRDVYPCVGAVVSLKKGYDAGYDGLLPPYIVLTTPQGRFSEAGFLGLRYKPFATGGNPNSNPFTVEGIVTKGITDHRQRDRRELLRSLDTFGRRMKGNSLLEKSDSAQREAYEMILGEGRKVFDLSQEKDDLRDRYGRNTFGQSCLLGRRLVERGVPYVTINYKGWDTHKNHFTTMRRKLPELDKGMASLLQDLSDRGLLESTIVWWGGEFGRTPKVQWEAPWNGGRGHWGSVFSTLVAGGGFRPAQVVGASDEKGLDVKDRPVYPVDLIASIYELLGIDPSGTLPHPQNRLVRVTPSASDGVKTGGPLKEIM